jgi:hypothetical protein
MGIRSPRLLKKLARRSTSVLGRSPSAFADNTAFARIAVRYARMRLLSSPKRDGRSSCESIAAPFRWSTNFPLADRRRGVAVWNADAHAV